MLVVVATSATAAETKIALCKYCNSNALRSAAETAVLSDFPQLVKGIQYVHVLDTGTGDIRYFEVSREQVEVCGSAAASNFSVLDPRDPGPDASGCFTNWVTTSTRRSPPASEVAEIRDAYREYGKFVAEVQDVDLSELELGIVPIDSAVDLMGPDAGTLRNAFHNALSSELAGTWWNRRTAEMRNLGDQLWNKLISHEGEDLNSVVVHFPDGTQVEVVVTAVVRDLWGNLTGFRLQVDLASAAGDQLSALPASAADFVRFFEDGFTSNSLFVENLADLFVRVGGRVDRNQSGGGCTSTMECFYLRHPDGELEFRCTVTEPSPELRRC